LAELDFLICIFWTDLTSTGDEASAAKATGQMHAYQDFIRYFI